MTVLVLERGSYKLVSFRPYWLPFNDKAHQLCAEIVSALELKDTTKASEKSLLTVASFLFAAQRIIRIQQRQSDQSEPLPVYFGVQRGASAWSNYPLIGKVHSIKVINRLVELGYLGGKVEGSGDSNVVKNNETNKFSSLPIMTLYPINADKFDDDLSEACFIDVGRPRVRVNGLETRGQRRRRKHNNLKKPVIGKRDAERLFGDTLIASEERLERLFSFWRSYPLILPWGHAAASATRIYHDGRMDAGGRLYGYWTSLDGSDRVKSTIDGEAVCEIDICASQPTLLSSLLGFKVNLKHDQVYWHDLYAELTSLWAHKLLQSRQDPLIDHLEQIQRSRSIAKGVVMEMIGTGNAGKARPSAKLKEATHLEDSEWQLFQREVIKAAPALSELEPRYDNKDNVTGYVNGAGFLSYHESEMIMQTLEALMAVGIPAFPVHDSLVVKQSDANQTAKIFRDTINSYCHKVSGLNVLVPLAVTTSSGKDYQLVNEEYLIGSYAY